MADRTGLGLIRLLDPERAHRLTVRLGQAAGAMAPLGWLAQRRWGVPAADAVSVMGITFANRIGIAAGFDKDAIALGGLDRLGVGHVEVGTVTPRPQEGNRRPRVFRLPEDQSVINRMGFPSRGAAFVEDKLRQPRTTVVGVNLGKARTTPNDEAAADYVELAERMAPLADYLAINVSSPNTPELRDLQRATAFTELLTAVAAVRGSTPVAAKLSPDLTAPELDEALEAIVNSGIDGVIAANTTLRRDGLTSPRASEQGGLSGGGLTTIALASVSQIRHRLGDAIPIIGVGGIMNGADARAMLDAGAELVQVYTGLIYRGPGLIRELVAATQ